MNRRRSVALGAVVLFAAAVVGLALVAGHGSSNPTPTKALAKLPVASATGARPDLAPAYVPEYRLAGKLPALPAVAPAYRVSGTVTSAEAGHLAAALGLHGAVHTAEGQFVVAEGTRRLVVPTGVAGAWFYDDQPGNADCPADANSAVASSGVSGVATSCPPNQPCPPPPAPPRPADLPTEAAATELGRAFLAKAGVDVEHARVETHDLFNSWSVTADPVLDGLPVADFGATVTVGPKGAITQASGRLGRTEKVGEYPLAGTDVGFARLQKGMFAVGGGPRPLDATPPGGPAPPPGPAPVPVPAPDEVAPAQPQSSAPSSPSPPSSPPPSQSPVSDQSPPVTVTPDTVTPDTVTPDTVTPDIVTPSHPPVVTVTGAHLGLVFVASSDPAKPGMLVPVYVFESDAGFAVPPVPAAVDRLLGP